MVELVVEHGPDLGLPHSRALGSGLFELRPKGRSGIGRAFYGFLAGQRVIVLHAFIKKTQQTSDRDLKNPGGHPNSPSCGHLKIPHLDSVTVTHR